MELRNVMDFLGEVHDPRKPQKKHELSHILVIAIGAIMAGCSDFCQIAEFGQIRAQVFKDCFGIESIPSHDTFNRVFGLIRPQDFEAVFRQVAGLKVKLDKLGLGHVALDGKAHAHSKTTTVSAWHTTRGLALGSCETGAAKRNELAGMESLIASLSLEGCVVTTDAMGCSERIASAVAKQKGDYVLALKNNQPCAFEWAKLWLEGNQSAPDWAEAPTKERHGVCERECFVLPNVRAKAGPGEFNFTGVQSIAMLRKTTSKPSGERSGERRYYIASIRDPQAIAEAARAHWGIENGLHWTLDVRFKEDANKTRDKNAQKNLMLARKMALSHLRAKKTSTFTSQMLWLMADPARFEQEMRELLVA